MNSQNEIEEERKISSPNPSPYTRSFHCFICQGQIEIYSKNNRSKTIKSWLSVCSRCFNKLQRATTQSTRKALEEILEIIDKEKRHLEKDTSHEYIDTCYLYKHIQSKIEELKKEEK